MSTYTMNDKPPAFTYEQLRWLRDASGAELSALADIDDNLDEQNTIEPEGPLTEEEKAEIKFYHQNYKVKYSRPSQTFAGYFLNSKQVEYLSQNSRVTDPMFNAMGMDEDQKARKLLEQYRAEYPERAAAFLKQRYPDIQVKPAQKPKGILSDWSAWQGNAPVAQEISDEVRKEIEYYYKLKFGFKSTAKDEEVGYGGTEGNLCNAIRKLHEALQAGAPNIAKLLRQFQTDNPDMVIQYRKFLNTAKPLASAVTTTGAPAKAEDLAKSQEVIRDATASTSSATSFEVEGIDPGIVKQIRDYRDLAQKHGKYSNCTAIREMNDKLDLKDTSVLYDWEIYLYDMRAKIRNYREFAQENNIYSKAVLIREMNDKLDVGDTTVIIDFVKFQAKYRNYANYSNEITSSPTPVVTGGAAAANTDAPAKSIAQLPLIKGSLSDSAYARQTEAAQVATGSGAAGERAIIQLGPSQREAIAAALATHNKRIHLNGGGMSWS